MVICELTFGKKLIEDIEVVPCVQWQEAQLCQQRKSAVFYAAEQVCEVSIEIVVDLHASMPDRTVHSDRTAAAEDIDEPPVVIWSHLVDDP